MLESYHVQFISIISFQRIRELFLLTFYFKNGKAVEKICREVRKPRNKDTQYSRLSDIVIVTDTLVEFMVFQYVKISNNSTQ